MLNKFIVVRSTVKPKEKSPDEKSKNWRRFYPGWFQLTREI